MSLPKLKYLWIASTTVPKFQYLKLRYLSIENLKSFDHKNLLNQTNLIGLILNNIPYEIYEKLEKSHFDTLSKLIYFQFSFDIDSYNVNSEKCIGLLNKENVQFFSLIRAYAVSFYCSLY